MSSGWRSIPGANLPRSQQAIILFLALVLAGFWIWQTGQVRLSSPQSTSQQHYYIEIRGHIPSPGLYCFLFRPTLQEVWERAGGRGKLPDGSRLVTSGSKIGLVEKGGIRLERMAGPDLLSLGLAIDPNHATAADLEAIPGIGPVLAGRIIEYREEQGPFQNIEGLLAVEGLGPGKLNKIRSYLGIGEIGDGREVRE